MFVGKLCTRMETISLNLICDVKSKVQSHWTGVLVMQISIDVFTRLLSLFFFLHGWTIHKFHALGSFKIVCKDYVHVCVCVCVCGETKRRDKDKEDKFYYRGQDVVKCQNLELNVCMGIKEIERKKIERKKNWCPRHIFSQGEVCPRQTLKAWDRVSWSLPCVYGK